MKSYRIGRGHGNDIVVEDSSVSRQHAELRISDEGEFVLVDLDSTNGTCVRDGSKWVEIEKATIENAERILLGEVVTTVDSLMARLRREAGEDNRRDQAARRVRTAPGRPLAERGPVRQMQDIPEDYARLHRPKVAQETSKTPGTMAPSDPRTAPVPASDADDPRTLHVAHPATPAETPALADAPQGNSNAKSLSQRLREGEAAFSQPAGPAQRQTAQKARTAPTFSPDRVPHVRPVPDRPSFDRPSIGRPVRDSSSANRPPADHGDDPQTLMPGRAPVHAPAPARGINIPPQRPVTRSAAGAAPAARRGGGVKRWSAIAAAAVLFIGGGAAAYFGYGVFTGGTNTSLTANRAGSPKAPLKKIDGRKESLAKPKANAKKDAAPKTPDSARPPVKTIAAAFGGAAFGGAGDDVFQSTAFTKGGIVMTGYTASTGAGGFDMWVVKTKRDGTPLWQAALGGKGNDFGFAVTGTSDGGAVVAGAADGGTAIWIVKLDGDGKTVWSRKVKTRHRGNATAITWIRGVGYAVAAVARAKDGSAKTMVLRLNEDGAVVWSKSYGKVYSWASDIQRAVGGGFVVVGVSKDAATDANALWVLRLDAKGGVDWQKRLPLADSAGYDSKAYVRRARKGQMIIATTHMVPGADGQANVATFPRLVRLGKNGKTIWSYTAEARGFRKVAGLYLVKGAMILGGESAASANAPTKAWVMRLTTDKEVSWQRMLGGAKADSANTILQLGKTGMVLAGETRSAGAGGRDGWMVHLDRSGKRAAAPAN
jgi:hypothetical protein